jgi:hypothetical protein
MPQVSIHCVQLMHIAFDAAERARADAQRPNALTLDSITAIVMASAAAEAFINELAEDIELFRGGRAHFDPDTTSLDDCAAAVLKLEEARGTTEEKYLAASRALSGKAFEKGIQPFQDFAQLLDLRDAIMHLKPSDTRGPKGTAALAQRKLTYVTDPPLPWFDQLETPEMALWAATAARNTMLAVRFDATA